MLNDKNIHDYIERRIAKKLFENNVLVSSEKFVYDGYLQIATLNSTNEISRLVYWDPSETIATRPLMISLANSGTFFPTVDLTKNVCELIDANLAIATTYDYTPFGSVLISGNHSTPFQFSSEFFDSELELVYYNYRHYNPADGRWPSRDLIAGKNLFAYCGNNVNDSDFLGCYPVSNLEDLEAYFNPDHGYAMVNYGKKPYTFNSSFSSRKSKDDSCSNGCRLNYTGVTIASYVADYVVEVTGPEIGKDVEPRYLHRLTKLLKYIMDHEKRHKSDYQTFAKNLKDKLPISQTFRFSYCDDKNAEDELKKYVESIQDVLKSEIEKELNDAVDKVHKDIGQSIDISEALVAGMITVYYPNGTTESIRLD